MQLSTPHEIEGLPLEQQGGLVLDVRDGGWTRPVARAVCSGAACR